MIPSGVTTICASAFRGCEALKMVLFQNKSRLTTIGEHSFFRTAIKEIEIPETVETIGTDAFENC